LPALGDLLSGAPRTERSLLELRATWRDLPEAHGRVAARLRVFVLNWDPLHGLGELSGRARRPRGTATASSWCSTDRCTTASSGWVTCAGPSSMSPSTTSCCWSRAPTRSWRPPARCPACCRGGRPVGDRAAGVRARRGWLGADRLGATQDLAQARFGPVDLDRGTVSLDAAAKPDGGARPAVGSASGSRRARRGSGGGVPAARGANPTPEELPPTPQRRSSLPASCGCTSTPGDVHRTLDDLDAPSASSATPPRSRRRTETAPGPVSHR
jgi:hypothetical protein